MLVQMYESAKKIDVFFLYPQKINILKMSYM